MLFPYSLGSRSVTLPVGGAFLACLFATACGGALEAPGGGFKGEAGSAGADPGSETGGSFGSGGTGTGGDDGTGGSGYVDPDCPADLPEPENECDPFSTTNECGVGEACYPYLEYPYGEGCGYALYGARCQYEGLGTQGASCEYSQCAPGYLCVVGTGAGARCAQLCPVTGDDGCPAGLICGEIDVPGFGVCS